MPELKLGQDDKLVALRGLDEQARIRDDALAVTPEELERGVRAEWKQQETLRGRMVGRVRRGRQLSLPFEGRRPTSN